jgi:DNA-directed RNA polymerase subunit E'/Rpb7
MIINKRIVLLPHELVHVKRNIRHKCETLLVNKISQYGYITKINSVVQTSSGVIQHSPSCSVEYVVDIDVDVFTIATQDVVHITVKKVTSMGIFGECGHATVFVPTHEVVNVNDVDVINYNVGDVMRVTIVGTRVTDIILCIGKEYVEDSLTY